MFGFDRWGQTIVSVLRGGQRSHVTSPSSRSCASAFQTVLWQQPARAAIVACEAIIRSSSPNISQRTVPTSQALAVIRWTFLCSASKRQNQSCVSRERVRVIIGRTVSGEVRANAEENPPYMVDSSRSKSVPSQLTTAAPRRGAARERAPAATGSADGRGEDDDRALSMARDVITLGEVAGRTDMIEIRCGRCDRRGRLNTVRLLREHAPGAAVAEVMRAQGRRLSAPG